MPTGLTGRAVAQERSRFGDRCKEMYCGLNEPYVKWAIFIMLGVSPRQPIQSSIHVHFVHLNLI